MTERPKTSEEVEKIVERWHLGIDPHDQLHDALGWSWEEYAHWAETTEMPVEPAIADPALGKDPAETYTEPVHIPIDTLKALQADAAAGFPDQPDNPFLVGVDFGKLPRAMATYEHKPGSETATLVTILNVDDLPIAVGDTLTVEWDIDPAYAAAGERTKSFTGEVKEIDDWIYLVNPTSKTSLKCPLSSVRITNKEAT